MDQQNEKKVLTPEEQAQVTGGEEAPMTINGIPAAPRRPIGYKVRCPKCGYEGNIYGPPMNERIPHYNCGGLLEVLGVLYQ